MEGGVSPGPARPALSAALSLSAFLLLRQIDLIRAAAPAAALALAAALGVAAAFLGRPPWAPDRGSRRMSLLAMGAAVGFALAAGASSALDAAEAASTGLPLERVAAWKAVVTEDSARSRKGNLYAQARLVGTSDASGAFAAAKADMLVMSETPLDAGMEVSARAAVERVGEGLLISFPAAVVVSPGSGAARSAALGALERSLSCFSRADPQLGALMRALLYGRRGEMGADDAARFAESGCAHVLALSGMHLVVVAAFARFLLALVVGFRAAAASTVLLVLLYLWVADFQPALLRSGAMFLAALPFALRGSRADGLSLLSVSFVAVVLVDPASFYGLSLQFSFVAVLGMMVLGPRCALFLERWLPPPLAAALGAGLAAQCSASFIQALAFGTLSPLGFVVSLAVSPLASILICLGFASSMLFLALPGLAGFLGPAVARVALLAKDALYAAMDAFRWQVPLRGEAALAAAFAVLALAILLMYCGVRIYGRHRLRLAGKDLRLP